MVEPSKRVRKQQQKKAPATRAVVAPARGTGATPDGEGRFAIVGIGASAGGLEALEVFLKKVPPDCGVAFVVVQHLDPTHEGMLAELLQRVTAMPVSQVSDGIQVAPNRVYVIPPNTDLSIELGVLHLVPPDLPRGLRLPIDNFFESLAEHSRSRAVGVILSGMGTDGTLGLKAIKARGGVAFVQEPTTAKFDGMPRSAIAAGLADVIAPIDALPGKIFAHLSGRGRAALGDDFGTDDSTDTLGEVFELLRAHSGRDFSQYKKNTVNRRIERRMSLRHVEGTAAYVQYLRENPGEVDLLFKELLIGVTSFFRDPLEWDALKAAIRAMLLANDAPSQTLRAWVAGCSTGEEAYTLAIICREALESLRPAKTPAVQIFATDLDTDAINRARGGMYPASISADVSPERLERFFVLTERGYQVSKSIRETVIFAPHDVTTDPPFTRLDVVSCRNLLIYLTPRAQQKLLPVFHYSLKNDGILLLGTSETIGKSTGLFAPFEGRPRLFRRLPTDAKAERLYFTAASRRPAIERPLSVAPSGPANLQAEAERLLLRQYAPAAVLVNTTGDILFVSGRTGTYLEPAAGKANWNLFAMARDGLHQELAGGFRKALRLKEAVTRQNVKIETGRGVHNVDVTIQPIDDLGALHGMLAVFFREAPSRRARKPVRKTGRSTSAQVAALTDELSQAQLNVRTQRQNMQNSREELSAVNEELQSSNEELQSTNEELTTSKEEMQSMNEELQTLNHELQARVDSLSHLTNDMKNLLDKTEIATVFLDLNLRVRLFTAGSSRIFPLMAGDVGRPLADFASALAYPRLADDAREVLRTLAAHEQPAATSSGGWVLVRIMPYRTLDNMVDGVTITFSDITASREREDQLKATQVGLEQHIEAQARQIKKAEGNVPADATPMARISDKDTSAVSKQEHRNPK